LKPEQARYLLDYNLANGSGKKQGHIRIQGNDAVVPSFEMAAAF